MKITSVKTAATKGHCMSLWVKIETDAGVTGIGECVHGEHEAIALIKQLEARLVGKDPFAIDALFEDLRRGHVFQGGFAGALITALTVVFFLGGWLSPFAGIAALEGTWLAVSGFHWLAAKMVFFMFCFLWVRATFPRYRYDQIMRLGWKVFLPITIVWIFVEGVLVALEIGPWAT